jgi:hypothetical protein
MKRLLLTALFVLALAGLAGLLSGCGTKVNIGPDPVGGDISPGDPFDDAGYPSWLSNDQGRWRW